MNESRQRDYQDRIGDEAADWFVRLQEPEVGAGVRQGFADWLSASPAHVQEYLALTALFADIGELAPGQNADDLIRLARSDQGNVTTLPSRTPGIQTGASRPAVPGSRRVPPRRLLLAASLAAVAVAGVWAFWQNPGSSVYTTAIGEQKSFTLPDGSVVTLNAVSRLQVNYTDRRRDLQLVSGEALFNVARNPQRPFRVRTADTVTQAVGTRFNVRKRGDDTVITVVEGRVKVAAGETPETATDDAAGWAFVGAGQGAHLEAAGLIEVGKADLAAITAWRERRLVFESTRLADAVAEFNLYNEAPLEITDAALGGIRITGSFYANDPDSFALFLREAKLAGADADTGGGRIRLRALTK